jgi:hypothetical protein
MTTPDLLDEAARLAAAPLPAEPFSEQMAALMLPAVLEQRTRLAKALLEAHPEYRQPLHQRAHVEGPSR